MVKGKLIYRIFLLFLASVIGIGCNLFVFFLFTNRYINHTSDEMRAKSVQIHEYLPFAEQTKIVKKEYQDKLEGDIPVIDGAAALFPLFSSFVYSLYPENSVIFEHDNFTNESALQYHNTRGCYEGLADKTIDIGILAGPNQAQIDYARSKGVEFELTPIGRESFVFLVNKNNPIENLTMEQLLDIYKGNITNWKDVGGADRLINIVLRNTGSGSQTALEKLVGDDIKINPFGFLGGTLAFSFRYYVEEIATNGYVKMLSLNGVYPNKENIQNGTYPIISNFYAVTRKGETNPNVNKVIDFILSETGQQIIDETGYVSL